MDKTHTSNLIIARELCLVLLDKIFACDDLHKGLKAKLRDTSVGFDHLDVRMLEEGMVSMVIYSDKGSLRKKKSSALR